MKEIKAYVRPEKIDDVVHGLRRLGVMDMTIIDVHALGALRDPESSKYSTEFVHQYSKIVKLEVIAEDELLDTIVNCILHCAHTGLPGDGMITVTDVNCAYRIREKKPLQCNDRKVEHMNQTDSNSIPSGGSE